MQLFYNPRKYLHSGVYSIQPHLERKTACFFEMTILFSGIHLLAFHCHKYLKSKLMLKDLTAQIFPFLSYQSLKGGLRKKTIPKLKTTKKG